VKIWRHEDEEGRGDCCSVITFWGEEGEGSGCCFLEAGAGAVGEGIMLDSSNQRV
jgi:hypothetical protein